MNFLAAQDILVSDHRFQPGVLTDLEPAQLLHSQQGCSKAGKLKKTLLSYMHAAWSSLLEPHQLALKGRMLLLETSAAGLC